MSVSVSCAQHSQILRTVGLGFFAIMLDIITDLLCEPIYACEQLLIRNLLIFIFLSANDPFPSSLAHQSQFSSKACVRPYSVPFHRDDNHRYYPHIRISAIRPGDSSTDLVWEIFWQHMEACIAVIIVSFSAFRSVFVAHDNRVREARDRNRLWYVDKKNILRSAWRRRKIRSESEEMDRLPEIPRATLTGMHTFINGGKVKVECQSASLSTENATTLADSESVREMRANSIPIDSDEVSSSLRCFIFF